MRYSNAVACLGLAVLLFSCSKSDAPVNDVSVENLRIQLVSQTELGARLFDVWGYEAPDGREFALVGFGGELGSTGQGVAVVDVTDPSNPMEAGRSTLAPGFDIKVWRNYMYSVSGRASGPGGTITDLSDPEQPEVVGSFQDAHNIFISDNGYLYLEAPFQILDLNPNPRRPGLVWSGNNDGHDAAVVGSRLYDFHGSKGTNVFDVSNPRTPGLMGTIQAPFVHFHHSGWPTRNGKYLLITDEGAKGPNADITVWDMTNLGNPELVAEYRDSTSIVHNLYIVDNLAYVSYYNSGFRVFDVSHPAAGLELVDEFDTSPTTGDAFMGAFGVYPFLSSGITLVSDVAEGLYIFQLVQVPESGNPLQSPH